MTTREYYQIMAEIMREELRTGVMLDSTQRQERLFIKSKEIKEREENVIRSII